MPKPEDIKKIITELNSQAIFLKGFEKALYGTGKAIGGQTVAIYDADDCLHILIDEHEMDETEAWEHFNNTVTGGVSNPNKPIFISDWRWAVNIEQIIEDIRLEKQQTLNDILNTLEEKKEEENEENEEDEEEDS